MDKRKFLLDLFTQDTKFNYHVIKTNEPVGHLIYLIKDSSKVECDSLEFQPTVIAEELVKDCDVLINKITQGVFFTEEIDTNELKSKLNLKLSESSIFSAFVEYIKDEYRILEIKDYLLYKFDPKAYEEARRKERQEEQQKMMEELLESLNSRKNKREEMLLAYNNDLIKLLKDYFQDIVEYEKRDFNLQNEFENLVSNLIDEDSWLKVDDKPFSCTIEICSIEQDKVNVLLENGYDYYTASLRFEESSFIGENFNKIHEKISVMEDHEILTLLYDIDVNSIPEWEFKSDDEKFDYVIDYLVPIFKQKSKEKEEEYVKMLRESGQIDDDDDFDEDDDDELVDEEEDKSPEVSAKYKELVLKWKEEQKNNGKNTSPGQGTRKKLLKQAKNEINNKNNNFNMKKSSKKSSNPKDWYFDVFVPEDIDDLNPSVICLSEDGGEYLDDQLGSHNLPQSIIDALNRAGIFGDSELMEAMWEVVDSTTKTKEDIIESMEAEGFIYVPGMVNQ